MPAVVPFDTIPQMFYNLAERYAGQTRPVLRYMDRTSKDWVGIPWDTLRDRVHAFAGYLHSQGVRPGDRVAILSENRPEWAICDLATQILGAVNVSLYTSLPAGQASYIVADSGAKVFVVSTGIQLKKAEALFDDCPELKRVITMSEMRKEHPDWVSGWDDVEAEGVAYWAEHEAELRKLSAAVRPDDLSALIYTSGTTGNPKGVMLTHENFCSNVHAALRKVPFDDTDHHLSFLPLCHSFERTAGYNCVLACGATITYAQSIDTVNRDLIDVKPTVMISVPRLFERIYNVIAKSVEEGSPVKKRIFEWSVDAGMAYAQASSPGPVAWLKNSIAHQLVFSKLHEKIGGNLRFAVSGGAALPKAIGEFFQAAGITIVEGYGLTETSPVTNINPIDAPRYGTVGHVIPGCTIAILDLESGAIKGQLSGDDYPSELTTTDGEIVVKGPNVMKGYWNNEESTREAIDEQGWYHTGDVGRFDKGYLMITDRIKHMIVSKGGKNIYPGPIEDSFKTEPVIDQIMVAGEGREYLTALVVPTEDVAKKMAGDEDIYSSQAVKDHLNAFFRSYSRNAAAHEKIRDFRLIKEPFTVENGLMTPTLKLRRRAIEQHYAELIDEMYADVV